MAAACWDVEVAARYCWRGARHAHGPGGGGSATWSTPMMDVDDNSEGGGSEGGSDGSSSVDGGWSVGGALTVRVASPVTRAVASEGVTATSSAGQQ